MIDFDIKISGADKLLNELQKYEKFFNSKDAEIARRLADMGATSAQMQFDMAHYDGIKDITVQAVQVSETEFKVQANGETVLFVEFGSGITAGYGHPEVGIYGPGTYQPSKGHWDNPKGWYLPKEKGGGHTWGNPPSMAMYNTVRYLEQELEKVVKEVYASA